MQQLGLQPIRGTNISQIIYKMMLATWSSIKTCTEIISQNGGCSNCSTLFHQLLYGIGPHPARFLRMLSLLITLITASLHKQHNLRSTLPLVRVLFLPVLPLWLTPGFLLPLKFLWRNVRHSPNPPTLDAPASETFMHDCVTNVVDCVKVCKVRI
jgi:hypothetical protein